jgi:tRNA1(Val) A37 N6-methylase TrmN6
MADLAPGDAKRQEAEQSESETSCDALLDGRIKLHQPRKGHRAGTDAILLAAAAPAHVNGLALDIGAGVGTAGLILASRCPALCLGLIENDAELVSLAQSNLRLNGLEGRGHVHEADIFSGASRRAAGLKPEMAELIMTNPPYADPGRSRISPLVSKRSAHVMPEAGGKNDLAPLTAWIRACLSLLAPGGTFIMIHKPEALPDILAAAANRIGGVTALPIHSLKDKPASRILVRGKKGSRAPFSLASALILQEQGRFTPQAEALHRGEALIDW